MLLIVMLLPLVDVPTSITTEWIVAAVVIPGATTLCGIIYKLMDRMLTRSEKREEDTAKLNTDLVAGLNGLTTGFKEVATEQRAAREQQAALAAEFRQFQRDIIDEFRSLHRNPSPRGGD